MDALSNRIMSRRNSVGVYTNDYTNIKNKYKVGPIIGTGSYGTVRKVKSRKNGEFFACKTIRKSTYESQDFDTLRREIAILNDMDHPNIVKLVDVFEDKKYIHLVQELCKGGELYHRVVENAESGNYFSEKDVVYLLRDILDAIRYCHDVKHIVHRDLKPENFLLKDEADDNTVPTIKIIDFGFSRKHDDSGLMSSKIGTPYYVAPEVFHQGYTYKVDIWSIGIITYILLCGYPPFAGYNLNETLELVKTATLEFPSPEWDEISSEAKDFIAQLLSRVPDSRPSAAEAMDHPWLTIHGANDDESTFVPLQQRDISSSMSLGSSLIGGIMGEGHGDISRSDILLDKSNNEGEVGLYPPLRMNSERSKTFRNFLKASKLKRSMRALAASKKSISQSEL